MKQGPVKHVRLIADFYLQHVFSEPKFVVRVITPQSPPLISRKEE